MKYYVHCTSNGVIFATYTYDKREHAVDQAHTLLKHGIECHLTLPEPLE